MGDGAAPSRYVKLTKDQAPLEEIKPGELNQPIEVPQVFYFSLGDRGGRNLTFLGDIFAASSFSHFSLWIRACILISLVSFFQVIMCKVYLHITSRFSSSVVDLIVR